MTPLGWAVIQNDWCPCEKQRDTDTQCAKCCGCKWRDPRIASEPPKVGKGRKNPSLLVSERADPVCTSGSDTELPHLWDSKCFKSPDLWFFVTFSPKERIQMLWVSRVSKNKWILDLRNMLVGEKKVKLSSLTHDICSENARKINEKGLPQWASG